MQATTGEQVIFQDPNVTVTTARAVIAGTTYAMANVTSVRAFTETDEVGCVAVMALFAILGSAIWAMTGNAIGIVVLLAGGAVLVGAFAMRKTRHWVCLGTAGAEANAIFSYDPAWTAQVVAALNQAMVMRG